MNPTEALICAVLRGENPLWPEARGGDFVDAVLLRSPCALRNAGPPIRRRTRFPHPALYSRYNTTYPRVRNVTIVSKRRYVRQKSAGVGYRRLHFLLRKEGLAMNHKRFRRFYCDEGLRIRKRGGRKRILGTRAPPVLPSRPNERWSLDFASDSFTDGRRFATLRPSTSARESAWRSSRHFIVASAGCPRTGCCDRASR